MNLAFDHWHIEVSSKCTLRCPRCPRAEVPDTLLNRELNLDFFIQQIGSEYAAGIKKVTFCGNDGDPIYCHDFLDILRWFKKHGLQTEIVIVTNGSYKKEEWWVELAGILDDHDELHWSLDGWDQTSNEQYRINSDWASIVAGIQAFRKNNTQTYMVWDAIAFRFNETALNKMKNLAVSLGFDMFQLTKSSKFGTLLETYPANDPLEPQDKSLIASGSRFERESTPLSEKNRPGKILTNIFKVRRDWLKRTPHSGVCLIGNKGVFLNSQGEFYPCCWTANRYQHNNYWHEKAKTQFNLHHRTLEEILDDPFWSEEFLKFDSFECQTRCTREKLSDDHHTLEW